MNNKQCSIEGCTETLLARGFCQRHYMQQRRAGVLRPKPPETDDERYLLRRVAVNDSGCWIWQQSTREGYGRLVRHGKSWNAHVFSFTALIRPVADGEQINHHCHVRACCNPEHLYAGSQSENMRDMQRAGRSNYLRGGKNGNSQINDQTAMEIYCSTGIARKVAELHGVSISLVYAIRKKQVWRHIHA